MRLPQPHLEMQSGNSEDATGKLLGSVSGFSSKRLTFILYTKPSGENTSKVFIPWHPWRLST